MSATTHLLVDLDDTLYSYDPAAHAAEAAAFGRAASDLGVSLEEVRRRYETARHAVKARLGNRGAAHSRLLYFAEMAHGLGRSEAFGHLRTWERAYWSAFLSVARLRDGARELLEGVRARGGRVAIVSDLTLEIQLWKLEHFGLLPSIDALVTSEEVLEDKPRPEAFELAMQRLGVDARTCVMVGDNDAKDGEGARFLGIPYFRVATSEAGAGLSLRRIAEEIARI